MQLSLDQVQLIERDVQAEGISYSHLEYDLLDHVCCDIEDRMRTGISFDEAYQTVKQDIGSQGLRRVQQETLLLINKNYRMMKKSMKTLGTIALASVSIAAIAKIMHWPGSSLLILISTVIVSTVFFPSALYVWYKEVFQKKHGFIVVLAFLAGFSFMNGSLFKIQHWPFSSILLIAGEMLTILTIITGGIIYLLSGQSKKYPLGLLFTGIVGIVGFSLGTLFKILHWPGAAILLLLGSVLLFCIFLPIYAYNAYKEKKVLTNSFIFSIYALTFIISFTFLFSLKFEQNVLGEFVYKNPEIYNTISLVENQINNIPEHSAEVKEINQTANNLFNSITDLKENLSLQNIDENTSSILKDPALKLKFSALYGDLQEYKSLLKNDSFSTNFVNESLFLKQENDQDWIMQNFYNFPLITSLNKLTMLQLEIRLIQQDVLTNNYEEVASNKENIQE